jgi:uroporphyrinogen decarboxylase
MNPRDRFITALERRPLVGLVPHFELVFFLTMEAFGKVHPSHRSYHQWGQMEEQERELHRREMAEIYVATAARYDHSAIFLHPNPDTVEETIRLVDLIREATGERYFLMRHGDATFSIPTGTEMFAFAERLADDPAGLKVEAQARVDAALVRAERYARHGGLDGFALCADYCFNTGPFLGPGRFSEFVTPYLVQLVKGYRDLGFYVIKHTDGNIMPILDQLAAAHPHALHSLDPQGGVDLAEVKRRVGDELCVIGNVNCSLLDTGTPAEIEADVRRALRQGMTGPGYIFSTSNCIYTGMPLASYETMLAVWRAEGHYPAESPTSQPEGVHGPLL